MNWLAHVYLSEPNIEFRLGNLLADIVKGPEREAMQSEFLRGARCHQAIDSFTDKNPIVIRSRMRISPAFGRFSGILIDVFYDYFLANSWPVYAGGSLEAFTSEFYQALRAYRGPLPRAACLAVSAIVTYDILGSYQHVEGIEIALERIGKRLSKRVGRSIALAPAIEELVRNQEGLGQDFHEFFPLLRAHVMAFQASNS